MEFNTTYRQKDKGWQCIVSYKDTFGKWKQKSKQGFDSKKEAKLYSDKIVQDLKATLLLDANFTEITFKEFITMHLEHISLYYEFSTVRNYKLAYRKFESLDSIELKKITPLDIQKIVNVMVKNNLAHGTITNYLRRLHATFNVAKIKYKAIIENPVTNIEVKSRKAPVQKKALTESELKLLLSSTTNLKFKSIFALAGLCGMRFGEIQGLQWNKIDFKNNTVTIDQQWKKLSDGTSGFGELKSANSYRTVPLPPLAKSILLEWKSIQIIDITNRVIYYSGYNGGNNATINQYMRKNGFDVTLHELRHTYATTLISRGIDFKTVAKLMGHEVEETMKIYSHVTTDMIANATQIINSIF